MIRVVSWNTNFRRKPWRELLRMDADVALLQEACAPPPDVVGQVGLGRNEHWDSRFWNSKWYESRPKNRLKRLFNRWTRIVKLSDRVEVEWFKQVSPIGMPEPDEFPVSGIGTVAAARVKPQDAPPFTVVSMYARWMAPHPSAKSRWRVGYPDSSAHRIISDLSVFIGDTDPSTHRILAAGDLNLVRQALGNERQSFQRRTGTVWQRMDAIGLEYMGPQYPAGRRADPIPSHLPQDTKDVPTFCGNKPPEAAQKQLDHVFASNGFHEHVSARAMNAVDEWGTSDHCRLLIEVRG
ncbi:MAG: hypothetical protein F4Z04_00755 [Acidobacteria bacterium]|nr:hypothetical protein [Acidobacteriota bacterium]